MIFLLLNYFQFYLYQLIFENKMFKPSFCLKQCSTIEWSKVCYITRVKNECFYQCLKLLTTVYVQQFLRWQLYRHKKRGSLIHNPVLPLCCSNMSGESRLPLTCGVEEGSERREVVVVVVVTPPPPPSSLFTLVSPSNNLSMTPDASTPATEHTPPPRHIGTFYYYCTTIGRILSERCHLFFFVIDSVMISSN